MLGDLSAWVVVLVGIVCVGVVGMELNDEHGQRAQEIARIERTTSNLARSLAQHADDTLEMADTALVGLVERIETDGTSPAAIRRLNRVLALRTEALPRLRGLFVYGEDGDWLATSLPGAKPGLNDADRDYFRHHRASRDRGPYLGPPAKSRSEGQWILTVSRRVEHTDGSFAGVVVASIDVSYFALVHNTFDLGRQGSIALVTQGGTILSRSPFEESFIGRDMSATSFFREQWPTARSGSYKLSSPLDGVRKIAGYHAGSRFPVIVLAAVGEDEALAAWQANAVSGLLNAVSLALGVGIVGALLVLKLRRLRAVQEALADSEANFRLLAENAGDMVARIGADWIQRYVSPASLRLLGRQPDEMTGRPAFATVEDDDRRALERAMDRLAAREADVVMVTHLTRHANGSRIWIETTLRPARHPRTGLPDGVVTVSRDVTERKVYEAQLAALASTDTLTGLANRRAFDEAIAAEWKRAKRDRRPLSLILLDIDRFKPFNDTYGHIAGDMALFSVATAISACLNRTGDLAARYGGEELTVLLPGTGRDGALVLADRIRSEIARLDIPHIRNTPSGVLTISGGVATFYPDERAGLAQPPDLVAAADRALYAAKDSGRNTVRAAAPTRLAETDQAA